MFLVTKNMMVIVCSSFFNGMKSTTLCTKALKARWLYLKRKHEANSGTLLSRPPCAPLLGARWVPQSTIWEPLRWWKVHQTRSWQTLILILSPSLISYVTSANQFISLGLYHLLGFCVLRDKFLCFEIRELLKWIRSYFPSLWVIHQLYCICMKR